MNINYLKKDLKEVSKEIDKAKKIYRLLNTYNELVVRLSEIEHEHKNLKSEQSLSDFEFSFEDELNTLFSIFKKNECLKLKELGIYGDDTKIFLIDQSTLLTLNSSENMNTSISEAYFVDYKLTKIGECIAKAYDGKEFHSDPYYCTNYYKNVEAFGLYSDDRLISEEYILNSQLKSYNNKDIRNILKVQSLDEIYEKLTESKNNNMKKLTLSYK